MQGICRGMNWREVQEVIFLWFFLSNRKFGVEITAGMGSVQLLLLGRVNIPEKEARKRSTVNSEENQ